LDLVCFPEEYSGTDFATAKSTFINQGEVVEGAEIICFPTGVEGTVETEVEPALLKEEPLPKRGLLTQKVDENH